MNKILSKIKIKDTIFIVTADKKRKPHVIGAMIRKVTSDGKIILTDNRMRKTPSNIKINKNVNLLYTDLKSIWWRIVGVAKYYTSGEWLTFVRKVQTNKKYIPKGAIVVQIKSIKDFNENKLIFKK